MAITNYSPRELTLSVSEKRGTQYVYAKQGDALSRNLLIKLVDDDSALTFGSGERAALRVLKPDGTSRAENATIGNDAILRIPHIMGHHTRCGGNIDIAGLQIVYYETSTLECTPIPTMEESHIATIR